MKRIWAPWRIPYLRRVSSGSKPDCIFCEVLASGDDAENHLLHRGESVFVLLNRYPYSNGHLMVAPNQHVPTLEDLDRPTLVELMRVTQQCLRLLREVYEPDGFNVGINIGSAAGAGFADHVHQHVVPRWSGDSNFMTTLGETRVIPEWIDSTYEELRAAWLKIF